MIEKDSTSGITNDAARTRPTTPSTRVDDAAVGNNIANVAHPRRRFRPRRRALLLASIIFVSLAALIAVLSLHDTPRPVTPIALPPAGEPRDAPPPQPSPTPTVAPSVQPSTSSTPSDSATPARAAASPASEMTPNDPTKLLIPVAGVRPEDLRDTYSDARSEGRTHDAIDIMAPRGTPVIAAAAGRIVKLFYSERGGTTIYQLDPDNRTVYYYAHLERYADGLQEGHEAERGEVIGYVGDTGNSGAGNYHLHFSVSVVSDPKRHWDGVSVNPYPLLR